MDAGGPVIPYNPGKIFCRARQVKSILAICEIALTLTVTAQAQIPETYHGNWRWNVPSLGPRFATGSVVLSKDSVIVIYDSIDVKFQSYDLTIRNDSVLWKFNFNGADVDCIMILDNPVTTKAYTSNPIYD